MKVPDLSNIEKTLNNEANPEEARKVIRWFKTSEGQAWLSARMDADEKRIPFGGEAEWIGHPIPSVIMYQRIERQLHRYKLRRRLAYVAAVLIPVALIVALFLRIDAQVDLFASGGYEEVYVPHGERMQVQFQDGSKVHLNSGSRIRYPKKFGFFDRKIELEGEAWFEVAKNKRPFIVDLSCVNVKVLGTTFDVKAYPEEAQISVTLETGSIELKSSSFGTYQLHPGEKAVYDRVSGRCEVEHAKDIEKYSAWRYKMLVFRSTPLREVMADLSRIYDVSFMIEDSTVLQYTYTLTTDILVLSAVLEELEKITPVKFEGKGGQIKVLEKK